MRRAPSKQRLRARMQHFNSGTHSIRRTRRGRGFQSGERRKQLLHRRAPPEPMPPNAVLSQCSSTCADRAWSIFPNAQAVQCRARTRKEFGAPAHEVQHQDDAEAPNLCGHCLIRSRARRPRSRTHLAEASNDYSVAGDLGVSLCLLLDQSRDGIGALAQSDLRRYEGYPVSSRSRDERKKEEDSLHPRRR